jgi:hypothetical protein
MSFRFIEDHRDAYPVRLMCAVLDVSAAGYYAWRERPVSQRAAANAALLKTIRQVHQDSGGRYGSPRVHAALRVQGRGASRGRIERLMHRHGIRAIMASPRRVRTTDSRHSLPIAPNLIDRNFTTETPNRIWLADMTYIPTAQGWLYLAAIMDLFSRCGNLCRKSSKDALRLPVESDVQKPTASRPVSPSRVDLAVAISVSNSSSMILAILRTLRPAGVGFTPPLERSKTTTPIKCSSCLMDRLSVDWRTPNISAACRKLPYSTAVTANRRC